MRAVLIVLAVAVAGCSQPSAVGQDVDFSHVHGIGYLPEGRTILVATHHGLVRGVPAGDGHAWDYASAERYDYMGFTQDGGNVTTLYSSGHPDDPRAYGGVHLGLRRSTDGGTTWEQRSLKGQVDFHSLVGIPKVEGGLMGLWRDAIMESRDGGLTWVNHTGPAPLMFDLAITEDQVIVATADGLAAGQAGNGTSWQRLELPEGNLVYRIAASPDGDLLFAGTGNGRSGSTYRSTDAGLTWNKTPHALLADAAVPLEFAFDSSDPAHILAATAGGAILESGDGGLSWVVLRRD